MKRIASLIMTRRAKRLFRRIRHHLPADGTIADIGSGTGHNAEYFRQQQTNLAVCEFDVADIHWVGPAPKIISATDRRIPAIDASFNGAMLLFVLQYPQEPRQLLLEVRRITTGPVVVLQSTYEGRLAHAALKLREFFFGRFGFYLARLAGLVSASDCPLSPTRCFTRHELLELVRDAGFEVLAAESESSLLVNVRRDLLILTREYPLTQSRDDARKRSVVAPKSLPHRSRK